MNHTPGHMISSDALQKSIEIIIATTPDDERLIKALMNFRARYFADSS